MTAIDDLTRLHHMRDTVQEMLAFVQKVDLAKIQKAYLIH
jgi:hypothetical protein